MMVLGGCGKAGVSGLGNSDRVPTVDASLEIVGEGVANAVRFTFEQLASMPGTRLDNVLMRQSHDEDEPTSWQGVRLVDLVDQARPMAGELAVTLEADDGYQIETTLGEIDDAIVALKDGQGRWLAKSGKRFYLRVVAPRKTANFWVANVTRIRVEPLHGTGNTK
jgi:hypothetical protein